MGYLEALDDSAWPIVYARFKGTADIADFDTFAEWYGKQIQRALSAGIRFVNISDTSGGVSMPPDVRRHISNWLESTRTPQRNAAVAASYVVVDSQTMRGVLTALRWASGERISSVVTVASAEAAFVGAKKALIAVGQVPPPRPVWLPPTPQASSGL